jgi:hypothetical protein
MTKLQQVNKIVIKMLNKHDGSDVMKRKLHNIRLSGAFSPEVPLGVLSRTSASIVF